jgi:hypothetical protein
MSEARPTFARSAVVAMFMAVCILGSIFACASSSTRRARLAAKCERDLDSAIARMDTTAHFPSQVRVDSSVKNGEIDGVVVSALTHDTLGTTALILHWADTSHRESRLTDRFGRFHIAHRAPGPLTIEAREIGYKRDSVVISSDSGTTVILALRTNPLRMIPSCCYPPPGSICL